MPADSPEAEDLDLVIQETKRCAAIIRRLLDFAREKAPEKNFVDLNRLVEETTDLIEQSVQGAGIGLEIEDFRPVFHDQGRRAGNRAGFVGQSRYHRGPRWIDRGRQHRGRGHRIQGLSPDRQSSG